MGVTIHAVPTTGGQPSTITIDKTGDSTGTIEIDGTSYDVYDVKVSRDGKELECNTKKLFFTISVTVKVLAAQGANAATVSVTIAGAPFGNGTTTYSITTQDETKLTQFFADSHFPVLA